MSPWLKLSSVNEEAPGNPVEEDDPVIDTVIFAAVGRRHTD
jgi:hypothetical protein